MSNRLHWVLLLLLLTGRATAEMPLAAVDNASAMYSHGVHGYFSGNFTRAEMYLQRATDLDPKDPRAYYFHGLTLLRLGRTWEAEATLQRGAKVEATFDASIYGIGEALQRVQGPDRLRLERVRREARQQQSDYVAENARRRYERLERRQAVVQRQPIRVPLEALMNPVDLSHVANWKAENEPAIAASADSPAEETTVASEDLVADQSDPFTDDPVETTSSSDSGVKAGNLLGIFGRMGRKLTGNLQPGGELGGGLVERARGMVPGMGGGAVPPQTPSVGEDPFGTDENPAGTPDDGPFATPSDDDPFATPDESADTPAMPEESANPSGEDPFN